MNIIFFGAKYIIKNLFFYLFVGAGLIIFYQHARIEKLIFSCQLKEQKLELIEKEAREYTKRLTKLQERLKEETEASLLNSKRILNTVVSDDCEKSLEWAVEQSSYIK